MAVNKVALVDDHILLRSSLAVMVNSFDGFEVTLEADNGQDLITLLKTASTEPDVILLDITMPVMNGYETAKWIKNNLINTRILVLSMMDNDLAIIRMLKYGAKGYILKDSKPFIFKTALETVSKNEFYLNDLVSNKLVKYVQNVDEKEPHSKNSLFVVMTERELEFLKLACTEMTYKEIAFKMGVSPRTVDTYRDSLFLKIGATSRVGLVLFAIRNGIFMI